MKTTPLPLAAILALACGGDDKGDTAVDTDVTETGTFIPPMEPPDSGTDTDTLTPPMPYYPPDSGDTAPPTDTGRDTGLVPPMPYYRDTADTADTAGGSGGYIPPMPYPGYPDRAPGLSPTPKVPVE